MSALGLQLLAAAPAVRELSPREVSSLTNAQEAGPLIAFFALALLTVFGALLTITRRNLISAVMALVATFFGIAGLYVMLSAQFLAAIQVLVYAGGIMVLFVFVIMVLNREEQEPWAARGLFGKGLGAACTLYLTLRLCQFLAMVKAPHRDAPAAAFGSVGTVGQVFFTDFLFPFEAISILLLVAVIGAVVLARSTVAKATSLYELPAGETNMRQPQHTADDEVVGIFHGHRHGPRHTDDETGGH